MIFKSINILGLTLAFVGALMLARPWRAVIYHFQNRQEAKNWDRALAVVALNNKPAAMALDKMHQLDRLSIGLPNRRVLNAEGLIDSAELRSSYFEMKTSITVAFYF